jgi:hypothetical protein
MPSFGKTLSRECALAKHNRSTCVVKLFERFAHPPLTLPPPVSPLLQTSQSWKNTQRLLHRIGLNSLLADSSSISDDRRSRSRRSQPRAASILVHSRACSKPSPTSGRAKQHNETSNCRRIEPRKRIRNSSAGRKGPYARLHSSFRKDSTRKGDAGQIQTLGGRNRLKCSSSQSLN